MRPDTSDAELDALQWIADPPADRAIAALLAGTAPEEAFRRIDALNAVIRGWQVNRDAERWIPPPGMDTAVASPIQGYLQQATALPPWADTTRLARAERIFIDHGALSVTMLFCASLPACYVVPDLAAVLHATGQLEDRAEHRIRATGAMVFPVMMEGGLTRPEGSGVAQVMKVRLIHATIRHLVLRGDPEAAVAALRAQRPGAERVAPLAAATPSASMSQALYVHGWDLQACGLPNNQEELAYTLLTFSYVFLRSLRRLGIGLTTQEEEDYLHAWNVAGHLLGIRREAMADTMAGAETLFERMQARGRADAVARPLPVDPRPALAAALVRSMQTVFPDGIAKWFPILLMRRLLDPASVQDLGLQGAVPWVARIAFAMVLGTAGAIDAAMRLHFEGFSISRLLTRAIGYRLTCALLMSQTRELSVPSVLRPGIRRLIAGWGTDREASPRMNALEDRFTTKGEWEALPVAQPDR